MSHFQTRVKNFFAIRENSFPAVLSGVASSLARTALCAFSAPPSSIFPQKILWICSLLTDYSVNIPKRHMKFLINFFAFSFLPLSFFRRPRFSPLPSAEKCAHFLQKHRIPPDLKDRSAAMDLLLSSFRQRYKTKKGARRLPCHALSMAMPRRHSFPAAPGDDGGLSPAFPFPRRAEPDDASSGRRSERSCPPARPR